MTRAGSRHWGDFLITQVEVAEGPASKQVHSPLNNMTVDHDILGDSWVTPLEVVILISDNSKAENISTIARRKIYRLFTKKDMLEKITYYGTRIPMIRFKQCMKTNLKIEEVEGCSFISSLRKVYEISIAEDITRVDERQGQVSAYLL